VSQGRLLTSHNLIGIHGLAQLFLFVHGQNLGIRPPVTQQGTVHGYAGLDLGGGEVVDATPHNLAANQIDQVDAMAQFIDARLHADRTSTTLAFLGWRVL
jgi:hypothetical protein